MAVSIELPNGVQLRPLTARSVLLSVLLGAQEGQASAYELVLAGREFGITETSLRATLSRMVAANDLTREAGYYRLSPRLLARQHRQDAAARPAQPTPSSEPWAGTWHAVIVTTTGRSATERAELRRLLQTAKLGELREGIWMRPDNIALGLAEHPDLLQLTAAHPNADAVDLTTRLWDLRTWADTAEHLANAYREADSQAETFTIVAAIVRHLLDDPDLPPALTPSPYPVQQLRDIYESYRDSLRQRRRLNSPDD